jgi:glycosyltransferase involved in cell wall biosynthesis
MHAKKILFITPSSSRGGSEKYIWNIHKNIHKTSFTSTLFSIQKGLLFKDYSDTLKTNFSSHKNDISYKIKRGISKLFRAEDPIEKEILKIHATHKIDIWYLNTITLGRYAEIAAKNNIPYIVHAHELLSVYDTIDQHNFLPMIMKAKGIIACSNANAAPLVKAGIGNVHLEFPCVNFEEIKFTNDTSSIRAKYGVTAPYLWVMSGQRNYRKGIDVFGELAKRLGKDHHLIWIGGAENRILSKLAKMQQEEEKIDNLTLIAEKSSHEYYEILNSASGLILTSREDPFPLVMIEAAHLGKPILGYQSGGIKEFINDDEQIGLLTDVYSAESFAALVSSAAARLNDFSTEKLKKRADEFSLSSRIFTWDKAVNELISKA